MIRINLISAREVEAASSRKTEFLFLGLGLAGLLGALLWTNLNVQNALQEVTSQVETLENDVAAIRKQNEEVQRLEKQKSDTEKKLRVVRTLTSAERRSASVHILDDLSSSTPEYLWLTDFTEVKGSAKINGRAVDNQTIASFARDLSRSKYFQKVEIRETAQEDPSDRSRGQSIQQSSASTPIPVKRFLIEAAINYLPTIEKQPTPETEGAKQTPSAPGGE
jgi:Tfp pilus assembly protein PilN